MITPAYSLTSTERVLPRMALDFTTGVLDSRVTITRALNTATRVNSSGFIELVNANLPRFDYDPVTLAPKGLLIEEARTNTLLYSEQLDTVPWENSINGTGVTPTITANAGTAPDNTATADRLQFSLAGGTATADITRRRQPYITPAGAHTFSIYLRSTDGVSSYNMHITDAAGATNNITVTGSWKRFTVTATSVGTIIYYSVGLRGGQALVNSNTADILAWGAQVEAGAFATSYIPTTTTSLTRNADAVTMTGTNFSSWYNASQGALYVEGSRFTILNFSAQAAISNGTTTNEMFMCSNIPGYGGTSAFGSITADGVGADAAVGPTAVNTTAKMMIGYGPTNAFSVNGSAGTAITAGQPTADRLVIGARGNGSTFLNGYVRKILYYPQRLTNRELQATSK
jgi:hypothetical protein